MQVEEMPELFSQRNTLEEISAILQIFLDEITVFKSFF